MPYPEINTLLGPLAAPGARTCMSGTTVNFPVDPQLVHEIYENFDQTMRSYPRVEGSVIFFEMLPYSRVIQVPLDATAYANRGAYHNVATIFRWHDPELDAALKRRELALLWKIRERGGVAIIAGHGVGVYANFAGTISSLGKQFNNLLTHF